MCSSPAKHSFSVAPAKLAPRDPWGLLGTWWGPLGTLSGPLGTFGDPGANASRRCVPLYPKLGAGSASTIPVSHGVPPARIPPPVRRPTSGAMVGPSRREGPPAARTAREALRRARVASLRLLLVQCWALSFCCWSTESSFVKLQEHASGYEKLRESPQESTDRQQGDPG